GNGNGACREGRRAGKYIGLLDDGQGRAATVGRFDEIFRAPSLGAMHGSRRQGKEGALVMPGYNVERTFVDGNDLDIPKATLEHVSFNKVRARVVADARVIEDFPPLARRIRRMQGPGDAAR